MMIEPSINELDKLVDSRYSLVCAVAKRAREIAGGADPLHGLYRAELAGFRRGKGTGGVGRAAAARSR